MTRLSLVFFTPLVLILIFRLITFSPMPIAEGCEVNKIWNLNRIENNLEDEKANLTLIKSSVVDDLPPRKKDTKYTPLSLRQEKPYAILWLIKRYPDELSSSQIAKLTGATKNTITR